MDTIWHLVTATQNGPNFIIDTKYWCYRFVSDRPNDWPSREQGQTSNSFFISIHSLICDITPIFLQPMSTNVLTWHSCVYFHWHWKYFPRPGYSGFTCSRASILLFHSEPAELTPVISPLSWRLPPVFCQLHNFHFPACVSLLPAEPKSILHLAVTQLRNLCLLQFVKWE